MVKRYDADGCQSAVGHYVSWDDYARLKEEFMDYIVRTQKELDELNKIIEVLDDNR